LLITELVDWIPRPVAFEKIVFSGNSIMPDQPEPNFDLKGNSAFPEMPKGSVPSPPLICLYTDFTVKLPFLDHFHLGESLSCDRCVWVINWSSLASWMIRSGVNHLLYEKVVNLTNII
jgi:hypothetical protein